MVCVLLTLEYQAPKVNDILSRMTRCAADDAPVGFAAPGGAGKVRPAGVAGDGSEGEEGPVPVIVDDRTWFQKNWLFMIAGGMMVRSGCAVGICAPGVYWRFAEGHHASDSQGGCYS